MSTRFSSKINQHSKKMPHMKTRCHEWISAVDKNGYALYQLTTTKTVRVARWLLEREYGPLGKRVARHRCDNPPCVRRSHLRPGTHKNNMSDMQQRGRDTTRKGEGHYAAKLTQEEVEEIRKIKDPLLTHTMIGELYGVSKSHVTNIRRGIKWKPTGVAEGAQKSLVSD